MTGRTRLGLLVAELTRDARSAGVQLRLGMRISAADMTAGGWDALVVATGSAPAVTPVPGCRTMSPEEVFSLDSDDGVLAVFDEVGDWAGAGLAEHLAAAGRRVFLITPIAGLAWNVTTYSRLALVDRLGRLGVRVLPLRRPVRGEPAGLVVADTLTGEQSLLPDVTAVVHAGPRTAVDGLHRELDQLSDSPPAVLVGDAYAPRSALEAVYEAQLAVSGLLTGQAPLTAGGHDA